MISSVTPAAIGTLAANAAAVCVAFGVSLSQPEQEALLAFVGSVTSFCFAVYAAVHIKHVQAAVKLAAPPDAAPSAGPSSPGAGG